MRERCEKSRGCLEQTDRTIVIRIVVSGAIQTLLGLLKLGRLADIFHSSVILGILAAIGIIIFAKQIHVALGTHSESSNIVQNLIDAVLLIPETNPFVVLISLTGLIILLLLSRSWWWDRQRG